MIIKIAKDAGYCFGVRKAVNLAYETAHASGQVYMLGHIVHNENVVRDLAAAGTQVVNSLDEIPNNKPVLFRAHGTATDIWEEARSKNVNIIDATCPLVRDIHEEVRKLEAEGRTIIIIGDHGHDEVLGIASQVRDPQVVATPEEARELRKTRQAGVVCQSTQMIENVQSIINILMTKVYDLKFINTICFPTKRNQEQIKELAEICDVMIVIGSFTSANSKRLAQLAQARNKHSYQVTSAADLNPEWFQDAQCVGISAGASTPDDVIQAVTKEIESIGRQQHKEVTYG